MEIGLLTFKISDVKFPVKLYTGEHSTHNTQPVGVHLVKIGQIIKHFRGLLTNPLISQCFLIGQWVLVFNIII